MVILCPLPPTGQKIDTAYYEYTRSILLMILGIGVCEEVIRSWTCGIKISTFMVLKTSLQHDTRGPTTSAPSALLQNPNPSYTLYGWCHLTWMYLYLFHSNNEEHSDSVLSPLWQLYYWIVFPSPSPRDPCVIPQKPTTASRNKSDKKSRNHPALLLYCILHKKITQTVQRILWELSAMSV